MGGIFLFFSFAGEIRPTTNFIESWHHRVNSHLNSANPNFYSVLSFYRDEERFAYVRLLKYDQCKAIVERLAGIIRPRLGTGF